MTGRQPVRDLSYEDLRLGLSAEFQAKVSAEDIDAFAHLSGDHSDLHIDDAYARSAGFPGRVAHGMLCGALYSTLVGVHLPGRRALLQGIELSFHAPVHAGEALTVRGEVAHLSAAVQQVEITAEIRNAAGKRVSRALIRWACVLPESLVILGASSDIGLALLGRLDGQVPLIVAHGYRGAEKLGSFSAQARSSVQVVKADLTDPSQVEALGRQIEALCPQPQALLHLAAPHPRMARFKDTRPEDFEHELRAQLLGPLPLFQRLVPAMAGRRKGQLLFLLSELTLAGAASGWAPYASAKHALLGLMRSLAAEYGDKGLRVGALSPGMVDTAFLEHIHPLVVAQAAEASPLGRNASADEVAEALAYLLSSRSKAAQGSNLSLAEAQKFLGEKNG